jgi:hypothetical protein
VVVAPRDATIFGEQDFAFAEGTYAFVIDTLGRGRANGGGYQLGSSSGGLSGHGWIDVGGDFLRTSDPPATPAFKATASSLQGGADFELGGGLRLGAAAGYESEHLSDGLGSSADITVARVSGYGALSVGKVDLSGALAYSYGWGDTARAAGLGLSTASRHTEEVSGGLQASTTFKLADVSVTPTAGIVLAHQAGDAFAETNPMSAAFAVSGAARSFNTASPYVSVGFSQRFDAGGGLSITPSAEVGYRYDAAASGGAYTLTAADGTVFAGNRIGLDRNSAIAGAGVTAHQGHLDLFVDYRAALAGDWSWQSVQGGLRLTF